MEPQGEGSSGLVVSHGGQTHSPIRTEVVMTIITNTNAIPSAPPSNLKIKSENCLRLPRALNFQK